jgi:hypothetical protein
VKRIRGKRQPLPEGHQAGLLRVQFQSVFLESPEEHRIHFLRVFLIFEAEDIVVGKPHQQGSALHARFDTLQVPTVQHVMQVDVRQ